MLGLLRENSVLMERVHAICAETDARCISVEFTADDYRRMHYEDAYLLGGEDAMRLSVEWHMDQSILRTVDEILCDPTLLAAMKAGEERRAVWRDEFARGLAEELPRASTGPA